MNMIIGTLAFMQVLSAAALAAAPSEALLRLNSFAHIEGQFTQVKTLQEINVSIKTEGDFAITKSVSNKSLLHWNIKKPTKSLICIDSEGLQMTSVSDNKQNPITKKQIKFSEMGAETNDQILNFFKLLSLNQESAAQLFTVQPSGQGFLLTPKDKEKSVFENVHIKINKQGLIENLLVQEKSHDKIEIRFFNIKTKKTISSEKAKTLTCEK